jgi:hypothetical protein
MNTKKTISKDFLYQKLKIFFIFIPFSYYLLLSISSSIIHLQNQSLLVLYEEDNPSLVVIE